LYAGSVRVVNIVVLFSSPLSLVVLYVSIVQAVASVVNFLSNFVVLVSIISGVISVWIASNVLLSAASMGVFFNCAAISMARVLSCALPSGVVASALSHF
jgi:hypothetical protein